MVWADINRYELLMFRLALLLLLSTATFASEATVKGVVLDPAGALVQNARFRVLTHNGEMAAEGVTDKQGRFQVAAPAGDITVVIFAGGFANFRREFKLTDGATADLEVKLVFGCSGEFARLLPEKLDFSALLIEIHHWGSFGCPEKVFRLWGTGAASARYVDCNGKVLSINRSIERAQLASELTKLTEKESATFCDYYPGGIDAPRVEVTVMSDNQPRVITSHDEADKIEAVTSFEQRVERLIDPEGKLHRRDKSR